MPILDQPSAPEPPTWDLRDFDRPVLDADGLPPHGLPPHGLEADEIAVIAAHERLSAQDAIRRGEALLHEPWGHAALRQMVWDLLCIARRREDMAGAAHLSALYRRVCARYANPHDRRKSPARTSHPFPCNGLC